MSHKDEAPNKVETIKKYLSRVFENPQLRVRHFFEPDRSLQSFRVEDADCGPISFGEEYFFDLPDNENGIVNRLTEARLPHAIRESNSNTRILIIWDREHLGHPKVVLETLDSTRQTAK